MSLKQFALKISLISTLAVVSTASYGELVPFRLTAKDDQFRALVREELDFREKYHASLLEDPKDSFWRLSLEAKCSPGSPTLAEQSAKKASEERSKNLRLAFDQVQEPQSRMFKEVVGCTTLGNWLHTGIPQHAIDQLNKDLARKDTDPEWELLGEFLSPFCQNLIPVPYDLETFIYTAFLTSYKSQEPTLYKALISQVCGNDGVLYKIFLLRALFVAKLSEESGGPLPPQLDGNLLKDFLSNFGNLLSSPELSKVESHAVRGEILEHLNSVRPDYQCKENLKESSWQCRCLVRSIELSFEHSGLRDVGSAISLLEEQSRKAFFELLDRVSFSEGFKQLLIAHTLLKFPEFHLCHGVSVNARYDYDLNEVCLNRSTFFLGYDRVRHVVFHELGHFLHHSLEQLTQGQKLEKNGHDFQRLSKFVDCMDRTILRGEYRLPLAQVSTTQETMESRISSKRNEYFADYFERALARRAFAAGEYSRELLLDRGEFFCPSNRDGRPNQQLWESSHPLDEYRIGVVLAGLPLFSSSETLVQAPESCEFFLFDF